MSTTLLKTPTCRRVDCPPESDLAQLFEIETPNDHVAAITDHVGECEGCQQKLDLLATAEVPILADVLRGFGQNPIAQESALQKALDEIHASSLTGSTVLRTDELKLDFLDTPDRPGLLGRLGRFDIVRVVGRGGMGVVLHAFDPSLQRDVAVKLLDPSLGSNDTARQRFTREARAAAAVVHENIVAVHQVDEDRKSGLPYFVMQLVSGESLEQRLRRVGKLPLADVIRIGAQAAAGLSAAHASGLIHRDIKPGNMLLETPNDRLKLTDFGLARAVEDLRLTKTGFVSGTPLYMAPEQAKGDEADHRADLFSLGVVLYESLAGKPPFEGKTPLAVLRRVADEKHLPLNKTIPDVPEWFEDIIDRLLCKNPDDRYQTAAGLVADLQPFVSKHHSQPCESIAAEPCAMTHPSSLSRRGLRKWRIKLIVLMTIPFLLGVLLSSAVWAAFVNPQSTTVSGSTAPVVIAAEPVEVGLPASGEPFAGNSGPVWSVGASPDGQTVVMGLEDGRVLVYDFTAREVRYSLVEHSGPVWGIAFFPDGKRFVSASDDGTVKIWEVGKRKSLTSLPGNSGVRSVAVAGHGRTLATGDRTGDVLVWDVAEQKPLRQYHHGGTVTAIAFDKDGMTVASAGSDKIIKLWNTAEDDNKPRLTLTGHKGPIYSVAIAPDNSLVASAGWNGEIKIWDPKSGSELRELIGHDSDVWSLDFGMRNGKLLLASAGQDGSVRVWDPTTREQLLRFRGHKPTAHVTRFSPDCSMLFSGGRDGYVRVWDIPK